MLKIIVSAMLILPAAAFAQANVSGQNSSTAMTAATIAPGAVAITSIGSDKVRTNQQAPSQSFSASFSPDSCATGAGGSVGTFPVALGISVPVSPDYCVKLRVIERLEQSSAIEARQDVRDELRDAAYDVLGSISPEIHDVLVKHMVIADPKQVAATQASQQQYYATAQTK